MGPFYRFNDRAKRVLALSQDEAIRFNHTYIGPEHLILGLVREGEGVAARVLDALGIGLADLRGRVEERIGHGAAGPPPSEITLAPLTKRIIEVATEESKRLGHSHIGTEHLLLGIVHAGPSIASEILEQAGANAEKLRAQVIATLASPPPEPRARARTEHEQVHGRRSPDQFHDADGRKRDWYCEDLLTGRVKAEVLWEDERAIAYRHPFPQSALHALVIPKKHVGSLLAPEAADPALLASMQRGAQSAATALGLDREGFQVVANVAGPDVTPHMHWHVKGPGIPSGGWR
ncbi:MAG TPA: Clp protease N-terminal domain-containing protein [Candidatus Limnocylindria bacterium]|nr:Clp protease N-terminal domain-containing protein [Candidatus Limnocylindria bacterium]